MYIYGSYRYSERAWILFLCMYMYYMYVCLSHPPVRFACLFERAVDAGRTAKSTNRTQS